MCDKTYKIYGKAPYAEQIIAIEPIESIKLSDAAEFDCKRSAKRHPRESKGLEYNVTDLSGVECCEPGSDCC